MRQTRRQILIKFLSILSLNNLNSFPDNFVTGPKTLPSKFRFIGVKLDSGDTGVAVETCAVVFYCIGD